MSDGFTFLDESKQNSGFTFHDEPTKPKKVSSNGFTFRDGEDAPGAGVGETLAAIPGQIAQSLPTTSAAMQMYANRPEVDTSMPDGPVDWARRKLRADAERLGLIAPQESPEVARIKPEWRERVKADPNLLRNAEVYTPEYLKFEESRLNANLQQVDMQKLVPAGTENSTVEQAVSGAAQSLVPSLAGLATFAVTKSPAAAMAVGLGGNYAGEASSAYQNALQEGATLQQAEDSADFSGKVSTALETVPMGALFAKSGFGKKLLKVGVGEYGQEAGTQLAQDLQSNSAGYTEIKPGEMLERANVAGLSGMMMGGAVVPMQKAIDYVHERGDGTQQPIARDDPEADALAAMRELDESLGRVNANYAPQNIPTDLTPEQAAEADVLIEQMRRGLNVPVTEVGRQFGNELDSLFGELGLDEGGISAAVRERREGEEGPSVVPHSQRIITAASDKSIVGLTPMNLEAMSPGVVMTLAAREDERNYPSGYSQAIVDTLQQWSRKYMPSARLIINLDSLSDMGAFGAYQRAVDGKGNAVHVITPREMPSLKYQGGNVQTRMESLTALSHEFGHAMAEESFFNGLKQRAGTQAKNMLQSITKLGQATPEQLASLSAVAPLEAGLVQEWLDTKAKVESGEMTAKEWMDTWAGTRKHGSGMLKGQTANMDPYEWARSRLPQGKTLENSSAKDLILAAFPGGLSYALSFDEYFAEQISRAAYAKGDMAASPLNQFFADVVSKLREFFGMLKKEGTIAPGVKFNEWLEDLVKKNAAMKRRSRGKQRLPKAVQQERARLVAEARKRLGIEDEVAAEEELPEEEIPEFTETVPPQDDLAIGMETKGLMLQELDKMVEAGLIEEDNPAFKGIRYLISLGEYAKAREKMEKFQDDLHYDREYTTRAIQRLPNKRQVKLETIKALMGQQTLRKQDREALQRFYEGATAAGLESAPQEDVVAWLLDNAVPLKFAGVDSTEFAYTEYGWEAAGENAARSTTLTLKAPVRISRERALGDKAFQDHFRDDPQVVAHLRANLPLDMPGTVILGEIQSDLMAKSTGMFEPIEAEYDPEYDPTQRSREYTLLEHMRQRWYERVVQETLGKMAELGFKKALIPLRSAVMAIQGFTEHSLRIEHFDPNVDPGPGINPVTHEMLVREHNDGVKGRLATIDFYEKTLQGFLKAEKFKMAKVQRNDLDYLEVDLTDKRSSLVVHWDRENPAAPSIPAANIADMVGIQSEEQLPAAMEAWEKEGVQSIYFKRWFGKSKLVAADTKEPIRYWYRAGNAEYVGETPVWKLNANWRNAAWGLTDIKDLRDYYVKVENPLTMEYPGRELTPEDMQSMVRQAQTGGFDGVVLKQLGVPFEDTQVLVWNPEQVADGQLSGKPQGPYFDLESAVQANLATTLEGKLGGMLKAPWRSGVALAGKMFDQLVQVQQRAVSPLMPGLFDEPLKQFAKYVNQAEAFKNSLQVLGEQAARDILKLGVHKQNLIQGFLQAEWKGGVHWTALAEDSNGRLVFQPSDLFRKQLKEHGIDPLTEEGQEMAQVILDYKNAAQMQLSALQQILIEQAMNKFEGNELVLARMAQKIRAVFQKINATPFMPQGHFGNYVLIVKESAKKNGKRYAPVLVQHFEDEKSFKRALEHWLGKQSQNPRQYKVTSKELQDFEGIPVNLPAGLLGLFQDTGLFSEEQLQAAAELMQPDMVDKISKRYEDASSKIDGASTDFIRNYTDFIWHNANFTWKLRYRANFNRAIQWQQAEIRELHKAGSELTPADRVKLIGLRRRNLKMMENTRSYILYPTSEFQSVRLWVTLAMLAYNFKTAVLNMTTMLNTGAALTTEYGEVQGTRYMLNAMRDLARFRFSATTDQEVSAVEFKRRQVFKSVMDWAIRDGVIDQSYAYFLAGQSTSSAMLRTFRRTQMGNAARMFIETGMWTFRAVEKMNRAVTLMSFFQAEFDRLQKTGMAFEPARLKAYETAMSKTLQLQNAYDAGNRSQFLRGKKSVFFIFMSYVQFMGWIMTGGYERGQRAQFKTEGRAVRPVAFGTTAKLWLIFLLLGGIEGLPFAGNLLDILTAIWRKVSGGQNLELELRKFINEVGGDSNLVMHGLMHNVGGVNLSGSFGLGNMLPGTELANQNWDNFSEMLGKAGTEMAGPAGGVTQDMLNVIAMTPKALSGRATVPEVIKELPGAIGAVGKAADAYLKQSLRPTYGVTTKAGERLVKDLETGEYRDLTAYELGMMALGASPTVLSQNREQQWAETGEIIYWSTRRASLIESYKHAVFQKDLEKRKAAEEAIAEFNADIPNFKLRISGKNRREAVNNMRDAARKAERGQSSDKRYRPVLKDVDSAF